MVKTETINLRSRAKTEIIDITPQVESKIAGAGIRNGTATVFVAGSTAGITTMEYESGLVADFAALWARIGPESMPYDHNERWGDGNGYAHVRASLLGASLTVPFSEHKLLLGTWQQIVLVDFDNRPRERKIVVQIMGE
jgi:secondary thiamine-phosphate synthase enzyme